MYRKLLSYLLLSLSVQAFDKAELLFEQGEYCGAVIGFLKDTQTNDARVFPFLQYCQQNNLVDSDIFDDKTRSAWLERLDHAQFAPTGYPGGDVFLQISLLAQDLSTKGTVLKIETLSRKYQTGYGFFVLARHKEQKLGIKPTKKQIQPIITGYLNGASYADPYSILALDRLRNDVNTRKIKIDKSLSDEAQYLKAQGIESAHAESGLPETTLSRLYAIGGKFPGTNVPLIKNSKRKVQWQFVAAQKGNGDIQLMWSRYANKMNSDFPDVPAADIPQTLRWSYLAALAGVFSAQYEISGAFYGTSDSHFAPDINRSIYWCMKVLESFEAVEPTDINYNNFQEMHLSCLNMLGCIYDKGVGGTAVDENKAFKYYKNAAELYADPDALYNSGSMIENGRGTPANPVEAKKYFNHASQNGSKEASLILAKRYLDSFEGYSANQVLAYGYLQRVENHPEAKYLLSLLLAHIHPNFDKFIITKDEKKANELLREAAEEGVLDAQLCWVRKNFNQRNILSSDDQDYLVKLITTLVSEGNTAVIRDLCLLMMENFQDRFEKCDEQIHDYLLALEKEQSEFAYVNLGYAYEKGLWGFEHSIDKAIEYYYQAPENLMAQSNLGFCLEQTQGRDAADEILGLYEKSLVSGNAIAAHNLGALYQNGVIVDKNDKLAKTYYKLGSEMGDVDATIQYLGYVLSKPVLTKEELAALLVLSLQLDLTQPYHQYVKGILLMKTGRKDEAITMLDHAAMSGVAPAQYTLGLYFYMLSCNIETNLGKEIREMREKSLGFLQLAENSGFELAKSANRILRKNKKLSREQKKEIAMHFLTGDKKNALTQYSSIRNEQEMDQYPLMNHIRETKADSPESRRKQRLAKDLGNFLDPKQRITFNDFQRIISTLGGSITNGKGSSVHVNLNGQETSVHRMHKSGQSKNVRLDPGRTLFIREFVKKAIHTEKNDHS